MWWDLFLEVLRKFAAREPSVATSYRWPRVRKIAGLEGDDYQRACALREHLHMEIAGAGATQRTKVAKAYLARFGGMDVTDAEAIHRFANAPSEQLIGQFDRIATWSKVLAIREPASFAIYDSRVALELNWMQVALCGTIFEFFPMPPSRAKSRTELESEILSYAATAKHTIERGEAYARYCEALAIVAPGAIHDLEMKLFAYAALPEGGLEYPHFHWLDAVEVGGVNVHYLRRNLLSGDAYAVGRDLSSRISAADPGLLAEARQHLGLGLPSPAIGWHIAAAGMAELNRLQLQALQWMQQQVHADADWEMAFDQKQQTAAYYAAHRTMARLAGFRLPQADCHSGNQSWAQLE